jgi:hypothetical protein
MTAAGADDQRPSWREIWKWRETWSGVDAAKDNWLIYSGVTVAPWGHIHEAGWRMRLAGGYGQYSYSGDRGIAGIPQLQTFEAATYYGDALIGYQERYGPLTAKAFVGISYVTHRIAPFDPENLVYGGDFGVKGALELCLLEFCARHAKRPVAHRRPRHRIHQCGPGGVAQPRRSERLRSRMAP